MKNSLAEQTLQNSTISITLPKRALDIAGVATLIGASSTAVKNALAKSQARSSTASLVLESIDWEWEEKTLEVYDAEGNRESVDVRTDLTIDENRIGYMAQSLRRISMALGCLGVPHDASFSNGLDPSSSEDQRARLNPAEPAGHTQNATPPDKPSFEDILEIARDSKGIEGLREWLELHADDPRDLASDSEKFHELLDARPELAGFIDAGASMIHWSASPSSHYRFGSDQLKATDKFGPWLSTELDGENPIARLGRVGLPIGMPSMVQMLRLAVEDPAIDDRAAGGILRAYCQAWAGISRPGSFGSHANIETASAMGEALAARPGMALHLNEEARSYFDLPLQKPDGKISPQAHALAEAHWLRAQSALAAPKTTSKKPRSL